MPGIFINRYRTAGSGIASVPEYCFSTFKYAKRRDKQEVFYPKAIIKLKKLYSNGRGIVIQTDTKGYLKAAKLLPASV